MLNTAGRRIVIVTPVLNDWASLDKLIENVGGLEAFAADSIHILAVDDGSSEFEPPTATRINGPIKEIQILRLKANQGHQRAIALGLAYASRHLDFDAVLVLDSDGEDRPEDAAEMLKTHFQSPDSLIVAQRRQRSEGLLFRLFYMVYKFMFRQLTGKPISFGNFSVIPRSKVDNVIYNPGVWNNYAATLLRSRIPIKFVPTRRGTRYFGSSTMNFSSLMVHGLSAISVFSDIVIGRLIMGLCGLAVLMTLAVIAVIVGKIVIDHYGVQGYFIPGYTTNVVLMLANILISALFMGLLMILSLLAARSSQAALPSMLLQHLLRDVYRVGESLRGSISNVSTLGQSRDVS